MKQMHKTLAAAFLAILCSGPAYGLNVVDCLAEHTKAECATQMRIEAAQDTPLQSGSDMTALSGKFSVTIHGDEWLNNNSIMKDNPKELAIIRGPGDGKLEITPSTLAPADFQNTLNEDMKGLYDGLDAGFKKANLAISRTSQTELMPLTLDNGTGTLGRFCYHIDFKEGRSACVYEGFITRTNGETYKLLGSVGDYDNLRQDFESIITSFKLLTPPPAPAQDTPASSQPQQVEFK